MISISCNRNKGYKWFAADGCWFKGYLQDEEGKVIRGDEAVILLKSLPSFSDLTALLKHYTGLFSIIIQKENETWLAVDIARSMPLYYSEDFSAVSDDVDALIEVCEKDYYRLDDIRTLELYTTSFVGFKNTIYKGIKQIELGCVAQIKDGIIDEKPYFVHQATVKAMTEEETLRKLDELTSKMIQRMLAVVGSKQIVLSLSGGYDSRYLACSLKKHGVDNVICYTYGRGDSFEVAQSKKVAEALGFKWYNVNYDDTSIKNILRDDTEYLDYCNRPDYSAYLQNYLAVKELHKKHLVPKESVFLTGLCNDMPTGYYIPPEEEAKTYGFTNDGLAEYNLAERFIKFALTSKARSIFKADILAFLQRMHITVTDYKSFISALDCLETANFHSHCFLNMNTVHEFFDYEWLLPCWDKDLLLFWYSVALEMRRGQKLYETYVTQHLANIYGVGTKKHINVSASTPFKRKIKRRIGAILVKVAYPLGIPLRRNTDINNFSVLEVEIYKRIIQKNAVKADRAALILMLTIYMMEYRYGNSWFKDILPYLQG